MKKETEETWHLIPEAPKYEISSEKKLRRRELKKVTVTKFYDSEGSLVDEVTTELIQKAKPIEVLKNINGYLHFTFTHNGKQVGRSIDRLYKKYVLGIEPSKLKQHRKPIKLRF